MSVLRRVWERWLADGIVPDTGAGAETGLAMNAGALAQAAGPLLARRRAAARGNGLEIAFARDPKVFDGRFANNAWLQELPHPVTKLTWDNAIALSQATADRLGVETGDVLDDQLGDRTLTAPAMIVPGHADDAHHAAARLRPRADRAHRTWPSASTPATLRASDAPWFDRGAAVTGTAGGKVPAGHHPGPLVDVARRARHPRRPPRPPLAEVLNSGSMFHEQLEERRGPLPVHPQARSTTATSRTSGRWPSTSTSAPAAAPAWSPASRRTTSRSSARSNVWRGREMQWLRIDRYFSGVGRRSQRRHPAARLRAVRDGALRVRLPGQRHRPQRRGLERDGLQPLHRHPVLHQQLPVQGPPLQLPRLHRRRQPGPRRWG